MTCYKQINGLSAAAGLQTLLYQCLAIGVGFYNALVLEGIAVFFAMTVLHMWKDRIRQNMKILTLHIELKIEIYLRNIFTHPKDNKVKLSDLQIGQNVSKYCSSISFLVTLRRNEKINE